MDDTTKQKILVMAFQASVAEQAYTFNQNGLNGHATLLLNASQLLKLTGLEDSDLADVAEDVPIPNVQGSLRYCVQKARNFVNSL